MGCTAQRAEGLGLELRALTRTTADHLAFDGDAGRGTRGEHADRGADQTGGASYFGHTGHLPLSTYRLGIRAPSRVTIS